MTQLIPSPDELRNLLRYEPDTGLLFWLTRTPDMFEDGKYSAERVCHTWNATWAGKEALTANDGGGYRCGAIWYVMHRAHRVIWAMQTGEWPVDQIDHENHNRSDNRWENLREATNQDNLKNASLSKANKSGYCGVFWNKKARKWVVQIRANGENIYLGTFSDKADAIDARSSANKKHGFHENHGITL